MSAPLVTAWGLSNATDLVFALAVGFGFGFVLERAGFGSAERLVAIFYGRDFRVMRVMFTAVVTAMLGLYVLDLAGVMPLGEIAVLPTFFWPQLVAGVLLGAGFIIGGYCPGTAFVGLASGKVDALLFVGGLVVGSGAFIVVQPDLAAWHQGASTGRLLVHEALGISPGLAVMGVTLFALGCFVAVGQVETLVRRRCSLPVRPPQAFDPWPVRLGALGLLAVAAFYLSVGWSTGHAVTARLPEPVQVRPAASSAATGAAPAVSPTRKPLAGGCGG